jgi:hypothetical protein
MRSARQVLLVGVALSLLLILYGVWITPGARSLTAENIARMAPAFAILGIYALVAISAPEGMNHRSSIILSNGLRFGCLAGVIFAGEILLEYVLLPRDNTGMLNFDLFILQDFFGACFFHLLLDPLAAFLFGSVGAGVALALGRLKLTGS